MSGNHSRRIQPKSGLQAQHATSAQAPSNVHSRSNYESNYPDGAAPDTGLEQGKALPEAHGVGTPNHDNEYGAAPPRDQIRPPELDIAASGQPAAKENVPTSASNSANDDYMRHFAGEQKAQEWKSRANKHR